MPPMPWPSPFVICTPQPRSNGNVPHPPEMGHAFRSNPCSSSTDSDPQLAPSALPHSSTPVWHNVVRGKTHPWQKGCRNGCRNGFSFLQCWCLLGWLHQRRRLPRSRLLSISRAPSQTITQLPLIRAGTLLTFLAAKGMLTPIRTSLSITTSQFLIGIGLASLIWPRERAISPAISITPSASPAPAPRPYLTKTTSGARTLPTTTPPTSRSNT